MRLAMVKGNIHIARLLIQHGANVSSMDKDRKSVLMMASLNGDLDLVKLLVYKGTDNFIAPFIDNICRTPKAFYFAGPQGTESFFRTQQVSSIEEK